MLNQETKNYNDKIGESYAVHPCWSFVRQLLNEQFGIIVPELGIGATLSLDNDTISYCEERPDWKAEWSQVKEPQGGDLVLFEAGGVVYHVALMIDENQFIHCTPASGVVCEKLDAGYWARKVEGFYRHISLC